MQLLTSQISMWARLEREYAEKGDTRSAAFSREMLDNYREKLRVLLISSKEFRNKLEESEALQTIATKSNAAMIAASSLRELKFF